LIDVDPALPEDARKVPSAETWERAGGNEASLFEEFNTATLTGAPIPILYFVLSVFSVFAVFSALLLFHFRTASRTC
jgi:hypothetical protein